MRSATIGGIRGSELTGLALSALLIGGCGAAKRAAIDSAMDKIWNEGDLSIIDDNYELELANEIKRFVNENRTLYPDIEVTIEDHVIKGNRYVTQWKVTGTHRELDKPVTLRGVSLRTREGGIFTKEEMFYDLKNVYDQLGFRVLPPAGVSPFDDVAAASDRDGEGVGATEAGDAWPEEIPETHRVGALKDAMAANLGDGGVLEVTDCKRYPCVAVVSWPSLGWREAGMPLRKGLKEAGYDRFWHWPFALEGKSYAVLGFPAGVLEPERHGRLEKRMQAAINKIAAPKDEEKKEGK